MSTKRTRPRVTLAEPQRVKAILAMQRLTIRTLAERVGVSETYLGRVVNGFYPPTHGVATRIAAFLGRKETDLFRVARAPVSPKPRSAKASPGAGANARRELTASVQRSAR